MEASSTMSTSLSLATTDARFFLEKTRKQRKVSSARFSQDGVGFERAIQGDDEKEQSGRRFLRLQPKLALVTIKRFWRGAMVPDGTTASQPPWQLNMTNASYDTSKGSLHLTVFGICRPNETRDQNSIQRFVVTPQPQPPSKTTSASHVT